jgi:signal transduction histidine kinase
MDEVTILIVEDELLIAKGLSRKLKKLGYAVVDIVSSGEAALEKAADIQPDLVLMDIVIKGKMDGIEAAIKIHELYNIPVIYLTAYADDNTLERARTSGSYGYILKPYKERELHATIKMTLQKHQKDVQLRHSLAEAKAIGQEKSRYLSLASHDLRNPLTTIMMSAELLEKYDRKLSSDKKLTLLKRIKNAANNMNLLLEDVLTLSQTESGKVTLNPTPLDLVEFARNLLELLQCNSGENHHLIFQNQGDFSQACLDKNLLIHILTNLLSNAIKYSPEGGTVSLEAIGEPHQVTFHIRDEGIGMPPDFKDKLFQQFERGSNVGQIKGTGLGLSIVKRAVELHGGQISFESEEGQGTTVIVTLPYAN